MLHRRILSAWDRLGAAFTDRELYMRAHGHVRFLRISARAQKRAAATLGVLLLTWACFSVSILWSQSTLSARQADIETAAQRAVAAAGLAAFQRQQAADRAAALEGRQQFLEDIASDYFGGEAGTVPDTGEPASETARAAPLDRMQAVAARQKAYIAAVESAATARAKRAEDAAARLGLDLAGLSGPAPAGGPFVPPHADADESLLQLADTLARLDRMERALLKLPTSSPAVDGYLTSSFGYRRDPLNGAAAVHMGQDFGGRHGAPIRAAAAGKIVRAGRWGGYGRAVVIDHGGGLRTRYGHMSKLLVKAGTRVARGAEIGRMGSTGRSTGTHLHFEVRVDGRAVDPRPFLETPDHVLKIQDSARRRLRGGARAS